MHMLDKMAGLKKENAQLIVENQELQVILFVTLESSRRSSKNRALQYIWVRCRL